MRVDRFVAECWKILNRSQLKARDVRIAVNGKPAKPSRPVLPGDLVELRWTEEAPRGIEPESIPLDILFENDRVLVVDKPQGMVTHPGAGNWSGTLANAVLGYLGEGQAARFAPADGARPEVQRPGIVHRLDKDTSGVIILAKDPEALEALALQFRDRRARKQYLAIVKGELPAPKGSIDTLIARDPRNRKLFAVSVRGGKRALTLYSVLARKQGYCLVSLRPRTGRTHQLRVHMRHLGHPILGDPLYAKTDPRFPRASLMLHAYRLKITLPGETEPRVFRAPLPGRFVSFMAGLGGIPRTEEGGGA